MDKPVQTETFPEAETDGACRMEDEGAPPLPDDGRRLRVGTQRLQRAVRRSPVRRAWGAPTVGDVMTRGVASVHRDSSIKDVAIVMAGDCTGVVPVVDADDRLMGLVTDRDIVIRACAGDKSIEDMRAADAMTHDPTAVGVDQSLRDAVGAMTRLQVQRLPVVNEDLKLLGMISLGDIARRGDAGIDLRGVLAAVSSRKLFLSRAWR